MIGLVHQLRPIQISTSNVHEKLRLAGFYSDIFVVKRKRKTAKIRRLISTLSYSDLLYLKFWMKHIFAVIKIRTFTSVVPYSKSNVCGKSKASWLSFTIRFFVVIFPINSEKNTINKEWRFLGAQIVNRQAKKQKQKQKQKTKKHLRGPDWESMSDLGNRGWPNSMKLGQNIDLDELPLDPVLFVFVLSSICFFRGEGGVLFCGLRVQKNTSMRGNFRVPIQEM